MRKLLYLCILLALTLACNKSEKKAPTEIPDEDYFVVKADLKNAGQEILFVFLDEYDLQLRPNENGNINDTVLLDQEGIFEVQLGETFHKFFLQKGAVLDFTMDYDSQIETLHFNGDWAKENELMADMNRVWKKNTVDDSLFFIQNKASFADQLGRINQQAKELLAQNDDLNPNFKKQLQSVLELDLTRKKLDYPRAYKRFTGSETKNDFRNEVTDFFADADTLKVNSNPMYRQLYLDYWYDKIETQPNGFEALVNFSNKGLQQKLAVTFAPLILENTPSQELEQKAQQLKSIMREEDAPLIEQMIQELGGATALPSGTASPDFSLKNPDGKTYSLASFKGKKVYIDLWATWCTPCIKEFPALKALQEEYAAQNVAFVSISIDPLEDELKWQKAVEKYKLEGVQLFNDEAFTNFTTFYNVSAIPRFILLDEKGNILDANAPRPGDPSLRNLL